MISDDYTANGYARAYTSQAAAGKPRPPRNPNPPAPLPLRENHRNRRTDDGYSRKAPNAQDPVQELVDLRAKTTRLYLPELGFSGSISAAGHWQYSRASRACHITSQSRIWKFPSIRPSALSTLTPSSNLYRGSFFLLTGNPPCHCHAISCQAAPLAFTAYALEYFGVATLPPSGSSLSCDDYAARLSRPRNPIRRLP